MPEDLLTRLQNLEKSYYGDKEEARRKSFFDTYGARFSNNRGLGLAVLNELDARGIDTSAADEAVTQILDQLRTQCNEIIESIKDVQQDAIENARKVEAIQDVVSEVVAGNPEASMGEDMPMPADTVVAGDPTMDMSEDMESGELPPPEDSESAEGDVPPPPPTEGEMPVEDTEGTEGELPPPPPPPEEEQAPELPPNEVGSDIRMKRIQRMKDKWGKTRTQKKREASNSWKPSQGMLDAAQGGR